MGRQAWGGLDYHSDKILIEKIDDQPDQGVVIILAEGRILNSDGSVRWCGDRRLVYDNADYFDEYLHETIEYRDAPRCFDHGQTVTTAKIRDDYPGKQIVFGERNIGNVYCFSAAGKLIWMRGCYHGQRAHVSNVVPINWTGRGKKELLCRYLGILDEYGNLIAKPPFLEGGAADVLAVNMTANDKDDIVTTQLDTTYIVSPR
jgi:hypothetical protein